MVIPKTGIIVTTQFEGIHYYTNAPEEVSFLRNSHRHIFHVKAEIEVFHDDRELEFILVKRAINEYLKDYATNLNYKSCEMIAKMIQDFIKQKYPTPKHLERDRFVNVEVWEDGENGAFIREF